MLAKSDAEKVTTAMISFDLNMVFSFQAFCKAILFSNRFNVEASQ
jgi:hypothetical protein